MASLSTRAPADPTANDTAAGRAISGEGTPESAWQGWGRLGALPEVDPAELVPFGGRAVVVAPHPDDEILGTGGLLARLSEISRNILIVAVTDGTASHPDSTEWPPERLARVRPLETRAALQRLRLRHVQVVRLGLLDGEPGRMDASLSGLLSKHLQPGDIVFTTWRYDGHPDHEAAGRAVHAAAEALDLPCVEVPLWTWHWASPDDTRVPWSRARRIVLDGATHARKLRAVQAFRSQLEPDAATGQAAVLPEHILARLTRPFEVVLI